MGMKTGLGKYGLILLACFMLFFNSCGVLLKERTVKNRGVVSDEAGLPLILYRSSHVLSSRMVVMLSGDGGWLDFNDSLAVSFNRAGFDVIGFNSRTYFWHQRTPDQVAADFTALIKKYMRLWNDRKITLSGYSFGADVVPFLYNRLPAELKQRVGEIQLLSPYLSTDFKVYLTDLINLGSDDRTYKVRDEVMKISIPVYCFYGEDEAPKPLSDFRKKNFFMSLLPGDHHYKKGYHQIVRTAGRGFDLLRKN
ncbi:hypothetical protein DDR33_13995 [Pararcticibacter amylolyticus]|uniref:Bacterial virulence domain-containing protein n=2 Tax=Pararcticibacter amylolyticus TaxID=2173175 RepID=A0A2U2PFK1_9SPHI|nr:hypothetical protein DDR33_13995 [Pararcticibacter amylolyticus]